MQNVPKENLLQNSPIKYHFTNVSVHSTIHTPSDTNLFFREMMILTDLTLRIDYLTNSKNVRVFALGARRQIYVCGRVHLVRALLLYFYQIQFRKSSVFRFFSLSSRQNSKRLNYLPDMPLVLCAISFRERGVAPRKKSSFIWHQRVSHWTLSEFSVF